MPIHDAYDAVVLCVAAVREFSDARCRIVLIDDASQDPRVLPFLEEAARLDARVTVRRNARNLGYLRTVNAALAASTRDVVLLNSDALVGPEWLERLAAGAYSDARVAMACPVSDNATLLTVVDPARLARLDAPSIARLARDSASADYPKLPVAVGFCLYLRRDALDALGDFDPAFDPGYGEENDLSMRAWRAGWSIVACPDVLVRHVGGSSFGQSPQTRRLRELHARILNGRWPQHDALVRRWWSEWPLREQAGRMREPAVPDRPRVLHVLHRLRRVGGTELHSQQIAAALSSVFECTLLAPEASGGSWADFVEGAPQDGVARWVLNESHLRPNQRIRGVAADLGDPGVERRFARFLAGGGFDVVHFHSMLHWNSLLLPQLAAASGAAVVMTLHSLESLCADYTLVPPLLGHACGKRFGGVDAECVACLDPRIRRRAASPVAPTQTYLQARHRFWLRALESADAVIAPSAYSAGRIRASFGDGIGDRTEIVAHGIEPLAPVMAPAFKQAFTVGFMGGLSLIKGAGLVLELARSPGLAHVHFELYGCADPDELPAGLPTNVAIHSTFSPAHLGAILGRLHVVLLPSLAEETFSLLLSECRAAGVPVLASAVGALAERIRHGVDGWLLPPRDVDAWQTQLQNLARPFGRVALRRVRKRLGAERPRTLADNAADYARIYRTAMAHARLRRSADVIPAAPARAVASVTLERLGKELRHASWDDDASMVADALRHDAPPLVVIVRARDGAGTALTDTLAAFAAWPGELSVEIVADGAAATVTDRRTSLSLADDAASLAALVARVQGARHAWLLCIEAGDTLTPRAAAWLAHLHTQSCDAFHGAFVHAARDGSRYAAAVQRPAHALLSMGAAHAPQGLFVRVGALGNALVADRDAGTWAYALLLAALRQACPVRDVGQVLVQRSDRNVSPSQRDAVLAAHCAVADRYRALCGFDGECLPHNAALGWRFRPAPRTRRVSVRIHGAASPASADLALRALRVGCAPGIVDLALFDPAENPSRVDRIVLVRADLRPTSNGWLDQLLGWLECPEVVAVAPRREGSFGALQPCGWEFDGTWLRRIDDPRSTTGFDLDAAADHARALPSLSTNCIALALDRCGPLDLEALLDPDPLLAFNAQQALRVHGTLVWTADATMRQQHVDRPIAPREPIDLPDAAAHCLGKLRARAATDPGIAWRRRPLRGPADSTTPLPRVAALTRDQWASSQLRVALPLADLCRAGAIAPPAIWRVRLEAPPRLFELAEHRPDTLLLHHCLDDESLELLRLTALHLPRVRRVVVIDDLVTDVPGYNPMKKSIPADISARLRQAIQAAHLLVTTSQTLAERYGGATPVRVIENALADHWFEPRRAPRAPAKPRRLRVGWAGAQQHAGDLELIDGLLRARPEVEWVFMGMAPDSATTVGAEVHPMVDFEAYPLRLAALDLDLALVPLVDNAFNRCKSALKLMEFGALGVPVIASDVRPYQAAPVVRVDADTASWLGALDAMLGSDEVRVHAAGELHEWASARHRQALRRADWLAALGGATSR